MAILNPPLYLQPLGHRARQMRLMTEDVFGRCEKVLGGTDLIVTAAGGATTSVASGRAVVKGDTNANQGFYEVYNEGSVVVTHNRDGSNPKVDLICLKVDDATEVGSGGSTSSITVVQGTPVVGASPFNPSHQPATPPSAIPLAYVLVPTGATPISSLADIRPRGINGATLEVISSQSITQNTTTKLIAGLSNVARVNPELFTYDQANQRLVCLQQALYRVTGWIDSWRSESTARYTNLLIQNAAATPQLEDERTVSAGRISTNFVSRIVEITPGASSGYLEMWARHSHTAAGQATKWGIMAELIG